MLTEVVHVAVGVLVNQQGQILISKRATNTHQGGLWEFPGGKLESNECVQDALKREFHEELGVEVLASSPLIRIPHSYPDKDVLLDVWKINQVEGKAHGREGQPVQWVEPEDLINYSFPAANHPIISAVRLPTEYMITGEFTDADDFIYRLDQGLKQGIRLVQLRLPENEQMNSDLINRAIEICQKHNAWILLNTAPEQLEQFKSDGIHLNRHRLMQCEQRPVSKDKWLSASVHNLTELQQAHKIGVDFVLVSPVQKTQSHPDVEPIGWEGLHELTECSVCPVYALGGMERNNLVNAQLQGAQGIAAISSLWGKGIAHD
ncbi:MAG: Nudix family hydrolase [Gammaproteobacteria bacterium]|nr:Nudix family hydrolase [Gammaproteobacteria bacterium]